MSKLRLDKIKYLCDIVKVNKDKSEVFYLAAALLANGSQPNIKNEINGINDILHDMELPFYLEYYNYTKVKIIIESNQVSEVR